MENVCKFMETEPVSCKSDISDKFDILQGKNISDKIMFCRKSWILVVSQELESVIYSFVSVAGRSSLDYVGGKERLTFYYSRRMSNFESLQLDSIKVLCFVIIYNIFSQGKFSAKQLGLYLLPLAEFQLSAENILYIFQTRFMGGKVCTACVQYSGLEVTWWRWRWCGGGGWCRRTGGP